MSCNGVLILSHLKGVVVCIFDRWWYLPNKSDTWNFNVCLITPKWQIWQPSVFGKKILSLLNDRSFQLYGWLTGFNVIQIPFPLRFKASSLIQSMSSIWLLYQVPFMQSSVPVCNSQKICVNLEILSYSTGCKSSLNTSWICQTSKRISLSR